MSKCLFLTVCIISVIATSSISIHAAGHSPAKSRMPGFLSVQALTRATPAFTCAMCRTQYTNTLGSCPTCSYQNDVPCLSCNKACKTQHNDFVYQRCCRGMLHKECAHVLAQLEHNCPGCGTPRGASTAGESKEMAARERSEFDRKRVAAEESLTCALCSTMVRDADYSILPCKCVAHTTCKQSLAPGSVLRCPNCNEQSRLAEITSQCSICYYSKEASSFVELSCGHKNTCRKCVETLLQASTPRNPAQCPVCRARIGKKVTKVHHQDDPSAFRAPAPAKTVIPRTFAPRAIPAPASIVPVVAPAPVVFPIASIRGAEAASRAFQARVVAAPRSPGAQQNMPMRTFIIRNIHHIPKLVAALATLRALSSRSPRERAALATILLGSLLAWWKTPQR